MADAPLLSAEQAARRLGIARASLYDWLQKSSLGQLVIHGQEVTIDYLQTGAKGQGRILIASTELDRLQELLRVQPRCVPPRRSPTRPTSYPGITVPLGRPD